MHALQINYLRLQEWTKIEIKLKTRRFFVHDIRYILWKCLFQQSACYSIHTKNIDILFKNESYLNFLYNIMFQKCSNLHWRFTLSGSSLMQVVYEHFDYPSYIRKYSILSIIGPQIFYLVSFLAPVVSQNTDRIMQWPWSVLNLN